MGDDAAQAAAWLAARAFAGGAEPGRVEPLGAGLIHRTYAARLTGGAHELVLQQLNTAIFGDPDALMQNVVRITLHLRERAERAGIADVSRRVLQVVESADGAPLFRAPEAGVWRAFVRIARSGGIGANHDVARLRAAAASFAAYARELADLPGPPLHETLPRFHDFAARRAAFDASVARDAHARLAGAREDVERLQRVAEQLERALPAAAVAALPRRIAHHDCKLDNLLFDVDTGEALCVLDLDTTMPGGWLSDFGELTRSASAGRGGEANAAGVRFDADAFAALARGYVGTLAPLLGADELAALPLAGAHMAVMNALRFAADHLDGDVYFRLFHPGQNLERARAQTALAAQMLAQADVLARHVAAAASLS